MSAAPILGFRRILNGPGSTIRTRLSSRCITLKDNTLQWILFSLKPLGSVLALYEVLQVASLHCPVTNLITPQLVIRSILLTGLSSLTSHGFHCWRIRVMGRSWYIPIFRYDDMPGLYIISRLTLYKQTSLLQCIFFGLSMSADLFGSPSLISDIWMIAKFACYLIITVEMTRLA
ncbi:hypothetical protein BS17DRAFT_773697 [Gyrodon lividus]|nr:hypothetical protein BS17DRAFT_773697 [Gyrodon lividus]